ncbi:MAG: OmpH family outer membrane protein [Limisphaerales bacterium]
MKLRTLHLTFLALAASLLTAAAQTPLKIATIDLRKVFDGYYKTKQADVGLKEEATGLEKTAKGMLEDYKKSNEDYKKLVEGANDQAVSAEERAKRDKTAKDKLLEIKQLEQQVQSFQRQSEATLLEKRRRMRDNLLREIREAIVTKARSGGYNLVIDTAADSVNQTPVFLLADTGADLTDDMIKALNASAPADALRPADAAAKPAN